MLMFTIYFLKTANMYTFLFPRFPTANNEVYFPHLHTDEKKYKEIYKKKCRC